MYTVQIFLSNCSPIDLFHTGGHLDTKQQVDTGITDFMSSAQPGQNRTVISEICVYLHFKVKMAAVMEVVAITDQNSSQ